MLSRRFGLKGASCSERYDDIPVDLSGQGAGGLRGIFLTPRALRAILCSSLRM